MDSTLGIWASRFIQEHVPGRERDNDEKGANVNISSPYFGIKSRRRRYQCS